MIKLPEPVAILKGCNAGQWEIYPVRQMQTYEHNCAFYDLSQLKQYGRDVLEEAAKAAEALTAETEATTYADVAAVAIRALIKEIE